MFRMLKKMFKSYDYPLIIAVVLLCLFGLVMVYSASMVTAVTRYGYSSDFFYQKQKVSLIIASIFFICTCIFPYKAYLHPKILITIVLGSMGMLGIVYIFGHTAGNAQSWLKLGSRAIQPSEFAKLSVILYLAAIYTKRQAYIDQFKKGVLPPILFTTIICMLVAIQPDFGTAAIIAIIAVSMIISSGIGRKSIMKLCLMAIALVIIASPLFIFYSHHIMSRVTGFTEPFKNIGDNGFQLANSYVAIGTGGLKGLGLGQGIQKYGYLPESHTDFIMAVIAEELGLFGVGFVLLLLTFIILKGFQIARKCDEPFGSLLAIGISSMIGIQSFINLGGLTGLIPITGVPLPFISYGGSSLLLLMISMGILVNISMFVNYQQKYKNREKKNQVPNSSKHFLPR
jgi:cell division protein FtsW